jgi:hypothetical protein
LFFNKKQLWQSGSTTQIPLSTFRNFKIATMSFATYATPKTTDPTYRAVMHLRNLPIAVHEAALLHTVRIPHKHANTFIASVRRRLSKRLAAANVVPTTLAERREWLVTAVYETEVKHPKLVRNLSEKQFLRRYDEARLDCAVAKLRFEYQFDPMDWEPTSKPTKSVPVAEKVTDDDVPTKTVRPALATVNAQSRVPSGTVNRALASITGFNRAQLRPVPKAVPKAVSDTHSLLSAALAARRQRIAPANA